MIIGVTGKLGAGKDTVGEYLVQHYGFTRMGFADLLKDSAAALFDITREQIEEWKNDPTMEVLIQRNLNSEIGLAKLRGEEPPITFPHVRLNFRQFLQRYGTEAHREVFGYNFWVDEALKNLDPNKNYVFTDVRFDNEALAVREHFSGRIIKVTRPGTGGDGHASEKDISPALVDYEIHNDGSIEDLHRRIDITMEVYFRHHPQQPEPLHS